MIGPIDVLAIQAHLLHEHMHFFKTSLVAIVCAVGTAACGRDPDDRPTSFIEQAIARADSLPRLSAFLVWHDGQLVVERYYGAAGAHKPADVKSVSKSFLSALVGIAIQEGYLREDQRVAAILPEYFPPGTDPRKREITIAHLLSMRSGLQSISDDQRVYREWHAQPDRTRAAIEKPMVGEPGARMEYSTGNTQILSAVLTRVTGVSTYEYACRKLAKPLNIKLRAWSRDSVGIFLGGNDMVFSPTALLRFGITYLDHGKFRGTQVVPQEWVERSLYPRGRSPDSQFLYGYGWWLKKSEKHDVFFAWGYGGQFIFDVPDLRLVIVFTSVVREGEDDQQHLNVIHSIVDTLLVPGFETEASAATEVHRHTDEYGPLPPNQDTVYHCN